MCLVINDFSTLFGLQLSTLASAVGLLKIFVKATQNALHASTNLIEVISKITARMSILQFTHEAVKVELSDEESV